MPLEVSYALAVLTLLAVGTVAAWKSGYGAASSLFALTFIWSLAFPVRAYLVATVELPIQAPIRPMPESVSSALALSCLFLLAAAAGYFAYAYRAGSSSHTNDNQVERLFWPVAAVTLIASLVSIFISFDYGFDGSTYVQKLYGAAMSYRPGNGWYFALAEVATLATIGLFAWMSQTGRVKHKLVLAVVLIVAIAASAVIMLLLNTRRPVAYIMLMTVLVVAIKMPRARILIPLALIVSLLGSQLLQITRFTCVACFVTQNVSVGTPTSSKDEEETVLALPLPYEVASGLVATSSSYEGADHFAMWLQNTNDLQKWTGVDYGTSWLFNAALSLIPRSIWPQKPMVYGSLAEQALLYPTMFDTANYVTLPTTFVVDFSYGFGIPFGLLLSFVLGAGLRWVDVRLYGPTTFLARAMAIYVFINMFNVVRSGTGLIQGMILFGMICLVMLAPLQLMRGRRRVAEPT